MSERYHKAIHFDLDTRKLKQFYPGSNYRHAYRELQKFFTERGFTHRQWSGYVSNEKLNSADVFDLLEAFHERFQWLKICARKLDITNIGAQFDLLDFFLPVECEFVMRSGNSVCFIKFQSEKNAQSIVRFERRMLAYAKYFQRRSGIGNPAIAGT